MGRIVPLIERLNGADLESRRQAAESLGQMGNEAQPAAVALVQACANDDEALREWVVAALEQLGPPAQNDLPALCRLLEDHHELSAYWAATLIGRLQGQAIAAVGGLAECVRHGPHPSVQQRAIWAVGQLGAAAREATGVLQQAAASSDPRTARLAREVLERIAGSGD